PGGVVIAAIPASSDQAPVVSYDGKQVMVLKSTSGWLAVAGIPLSAVPGQLELSVKTADAPEATLRFDVRDKKYSMQSLKVAPGKVDLSPQDAERAAQDTARIRAALATYSAQPPATLKL